MDEKRDNFKRLLRSLKIDEGRSQEVQGWLTENERKAINATFTKDGRVTPETKRLFFAARKRLAQDIRSGNADRPNKQ